MGRVVRRRWIFTRQDDDLVERQTSHPGRQTEIHYGTLSPHSIFESEDPEIQHCLSGREIAKQLQCRIPAIQKCFTFTQYIFILVILQRIYCIRTFTSSPTSISYKLIKQAPFKNYVSIYRLISIFQYVKCLVTSYMAGILFLIFPRTFLVVTKMIFQSYSQWVPETTTI